LNERRERKGKQEREMKRERKTKNNKCWEKESMEGRKEGRKNVTDIGENVKKPPVLINQ
jgi:competence transcription factor ComK